MSEYIEREAAIEMIKNDLPEQVRYYRQDAIECLECMPTADVVPKSEVEKIFAEIESIIRKHDERPKYQLILDLAELKKKYTGE